MSAANYCLQNAGAYYVTGQNPEEFFLSGFASRDWHRAGLEPEKAGELSRSYYGVYLLQKTFQVEIPGGHLYDLTAKIVWRSGYYSGAILDYEIFGGSYVGKMSDYRDSDDFALDVIDDIIDDCSNYYGWNPGVCAALRPKVEKAVEDAFNAIAKDSENVCQALADSSLVCVGIFSNGEAIYKPIN